MDGLTRELRKLRQSIETLMSINDTPICIEDVIYELRSMDCSDSEIALWLMQCDNKLGAIPLDMIHEGNVESVVRRLREVKSI